MRPREGEAPAEPAMAIGSPGGSPSRTILHRFLERIDKLQFAAGHASGQVLGMIVHRHVEQVVQDQARPAVDLQEAPEPLAVLASEPRVGDAGHQPDEKPDGLGQEERLLAVRARMRQPVLLLLDADVERRLQPQRIGAVEVGFGS